LAGSAIGQQLLSYTAGDHSKKLLDTDSNFFSSSFGILSDLYIILSLAIGLLLNLLGISPIQALIYSGILYGVTAPVIILIIMHISNNKKIMGKHVNSPWLRLYDACTDVCRCYRFALVSIFLKYIHQSNSTIGAPLK
jgi:Mn2+/Fe2+ NRAMP family transporter